MTDVTPRTEFVDEAKAVELARQAVVLFNASDEDKVEAWFKLQAVADQVGEASNTGIRGISWATDPPKSPKYQLTGQTAKGRFQHSLKAPATLDEALLPENLDLAVAARERTAAKYGGEILSGRRPAGTSEAMLRAVAASDEGAEWLSRVKESCAREQCLKAVRVADTYGRDGVFACASLGAHIVFVTYETRAEDIRKFPGYGAAAAEHMRRQGAAPRDPGSSRRATDSQVSRLAASAGTTRRMARATLQEMLDGRDKLPLIRCINEAKKMVDAMDKSK